MIIVRYPKKYLNESFSYPGQKERFKLLSVSDNGFIFYFNKNHLCTDSIFIDLIRCKTGNQIYIEQLQTEINF